MQSVAKFSLSVILLASVVASTYQSTKLRRDGVLNLYPFPRVGRASHRTWQVPISDLMDTEQIKRQLYAFPRVGRSEISVQTDQMTPQLENILFARNNPFVKRQIFSEPHAEYDRPGMWFGPRLGRAYKGENDDQNDTERSEPEQIDTSTTNREKRETKQI